MVGGPGGRGMSRELELLVSSILLVDLLLVRPLLLALLLVLPLLLEL